MATVVAVEEGVTVRRKVSNDHAGRISTTFVVVAAADLYSSNPRREHWGWPPLQKNERLWLLVADSLEVTSGPCSACCSLRSTMVLRGNGTEQVASIGVSGME